MPGGKAILAFIIPSLLGILAFLTPIRVEGSWTILMGYVSDSLGNAIGAGMPWVDFTLLCTFIGLPIVLAFAHLFVY